MKQIINHLNTLKEKIKFEKVFCEQIWNLNINYVSFFHMFRYNIKKIIITKGNTKI